MRTDADSYLDDLPSVPPSFDFDLIGSALADVLIQPAEGATVIGVHGPWGSGKTTLMYAIRDELRYRLGDTGLVIVEFNAWKFHAREALWRALILRLVGELRLRDAPAEKLDELEASLYRAFEIEEAGPWSINWRDAATEIASVALELLQLGFAGKILQRIFGRRSKGDEEGIVGQEDIERIGGLLERESVNRHVAQVQSIEQFLGIFRELVGELLESDRRVVVLVDDLDRCLPEAALEIFEAIKLFLDAPGCGFVVAVDRDVIRKGLAVRYTAADGSGTAFPLVNPDEYIEKTIALSYDVPRFSDEDVDALIADAQTPLPLNADHRALLHAGLGRNPRRVKRFLNLLRVQVELASLASQKGRPAPSALGPEGDPTMLGTLLKAMLIGYRYPSLLRACIEDPNLLFTLQRIATAYRKATADGEAAAKTERGEKLADMPAEVAALQHHEEFWALMARGPNLVSHQAAAVDLVDWFRRSGMGDSTG